ncbi:GNAT family N-acetyltransferase [Candidatus Hydrogenedentota bacterium]
MEIEIREEDPRALEEYGQVSIAFRVESILKVNAIDDGLGGFMLTEEQIESPYAKDYDADSGEGPARWEELWDTSHWGSFSAFVDERRAGGATVAHDTDGLFMLEGRKDLACLWDIRVDPEFRGKGVGTRLFQHAVEWAGSRNCRFLKIETQNINVPACRFYARQGCELGAINLHAYSALPEEIMLLWYKEID